MSQAVRNNVKTCSTVICHHTQLCLDMSSAMSADKPSVEPVTTLSVDMAGALDSVAVFKARGTEVGLGP